MSVAIKKEDTKGKKKTPQEPEEATHFDEAFAIFHIKLKCQVFAIGAEMHIKKSFRDKMLCAV
ncbi:MAG: hypothetical protein E6Q34_01420 [Burkholderiaceae bacterium]|nr:MAG: hypothetical protein E6Q34_01420 [Burkholderiaceae bacterium]